MSRRDTIIVAALINAGLLIILFVSALKNPSPSETLVMAPENLSHHSLDSSVKSDVKAVMGDEVDQVLSQYSKQNPLQSAPVTLVSETPVVQEIQQPVVAVAPAPTENFVDDLNALTKATEQVATQEVSVVSAPFATFVEVKIKKGDVLEKIARGHQCSVQEIMKVNKLSSTNLKIGQVLRIPTKGHPAVAKNVVPVSTTDTALKYYVVKSGDNPWTIAVKNHIKVEELLKLNNMDEAKARKLKPGDQILIR